RTRVVAEDIPNPFFSSLLDMNIRCGNILVGCVSTEDLQRAHDGDWVVAETVIALKEQAVRLRDIYRSFQDAQRAELQDRTLEWKGKLQVGTDSLRDQLDHLYSKSDSQVAGWNSDEWRKSHQPFHWIAEFPEAVLEGGFSVVVGNPPFVRKSKVGYSFHGFESDSAPDIYAPCLERSAQMVVDGGRLAMIAPISLVRGSEKGFMYLRQSLETTLPIRWFSVYGLIPGNLFKAKVNPVLLVGHAVSGGNAVVSSSNLRRWRQEYREHLFETVVYSRSYSDQKLQSTWPMIGDPAASDLLRELSSSGKSIGIWVRRRGGFRVGRKTVRNLRFLTVFLREPPCWEMLDGSPGHRVEQSEVHWMGFDEELHQHAAFLLGAGRFGHWLWTTIGDAFHVTSGMVEWFPCDLDRLRPVADEVIHLGHELSDRMMNAPLVDRNKKFVGGYNLGTCRDLTDEADRLIMERLGVGDYWPTVVALDNRIVKSRGRGVKTLYHWVKNWTPTYGPWDPSMPE
ncbi:MAG: hypothetical protein OXG36_10330, partial [Caldilineaceae bacterium]|nr:hypothetical protein [Caldilineaceae bacterium]